MNEKEILEYADNIIKQIFAPNLKITVEFAEVNGWDYLVAYIGENEAGGVFLSYGESNAYYLEKVETLIQEGVLYYMFTKYRKEILCENLS